MSPVFPIISPPKKDGSYLVLAPQSFPKNSRWMVAEFYTDNQMFYSEAGGEHALPDVVAWTELPPEDDAYWSLTCQPDMAKVVEALEAVIRDLRELASPPFGCSHSARQSKLISDCLTSLLILKQEVFRG